MSTRYWSNKSIASKVILTNEWNNYIHNVLAEDLQTIKQFIHLSTNQPLPHIVTASMQGHFHVVGLSDVSLL